MNFFVMGVEEEESAESKTPKPPKRPIPVPMGKKRPIEGDLTPEPRAASRLRRYGRMSRSSSFRIQQIESASTAIKYRANAIAKARYKKLVQHNCHELLENQKVVESDRSNDRSNDSCSDGSRSGDEPTAAWRKDVKTMSREQIERECQMLERKLKALLKQNEDMDDEISDLRQSLFEANKRVSDLELMITE